MKCAALWSLAGAACAGSDRPGAALMVTTVAGVPGVSAFSEAEGELAVDAPLFWPVDVEWAPWGDLYVAEFNNHRIVRVTADGGLLRVAGTGSLGEGPEGDALRASLNKPAGVILDPNDPGRLLVTAWGNGRVAAVNLAAGTLQFVAGAGGPGFSGDGGDVSEALFDNPSSVAVSADGVVFVSDEDNQVIRRIDPGNIVNSVAGTPRVAGWKGDGGPAHDALLHSPVAEEGFGPPGGRIALDGDRLFVADTANHAIRVVDLTTGLIHAVAGRPDADDFHLPSDVAVAPDGALIVADTGNHCIRRVDLDGSTRTLAGRCGEAGFADGPADDARFFSPFGVAVDDDGAVWVADTDNHLVRRIGPTDPGSPD